MKYIGAHVSAQGGVFNAPLNAMRVGAKALSFFTKNQRQWSAPPYTQEDISQFKNNLKKSGILASQVLAHASYLINPGSPDEQKRKMSVDALIDETNRCEQLGVSMLNFHPGSHVKKISEKKCLQLVAESINAALAATKNVTLVIENTAGQGGNVGYKLEHLAFIIGHIENKKRIGVCIDTCHLFVAGYDFRTKKEYKKTWGQFEEIVGFKYLKGIHLNDSLTELGSKKDRHESIGKGEIGLEAFKLLMQDPRFDNMPLVLETRDSSIWEKEIKLLYSFSS